MTEDHELLRCYVEDRSQVAFAELVKRRVNLVYSVALRQVGGDVYLAQDVTQRVFTDLARKASALAGRPVLTGWLYRSAQFAASDIVRSERRRRTREQENQIMNEISAGAHGADESAEWEELRPVIDEAMGELNDEDRDAVALRFLEEKSFAEIGRQLELSEEAARKRVSRALMKLQGLLARRGVTSTESALALVLANQAVAAVPAGFVEGVTSGALASAVAGAGTAEWGVLTFMGTTKLAIGLIGVAAVVGIGVARWGSTRAQEARAALATVTQELAALSVMLEKLKIRAQAEAQRVQAAEAENARLLAAAEKLKSPAVVPVTGEIEPVTSGMVQARWKRAQELAKDGDPAEALRELLWCYDVGMVNVTSMLGVRFSYALSLLAKLGERYPAALHELSERRDKARERVLASESDSSAALEFGAINHALKDDGLTIALYDQLPGGDRRRRPLATTAYDSFVETQRYKDAAEVRPYSMISSMFEWNIQERPLAPSLPNSEEVRKRTRESAVAVTAKNIEMLAGSGDLAHARTLAQRLLAYDNSDATKALIQKHAERAGQPGLMSPTSNP